MTNFKAKMHQIRFRVGLRPRPRWGSLQRSPDPLAGFGGRETAGGEAGLGKWREREGPKLLLNQGPSEPCYATDHGGLGSQDHPNPPWSTPLMFLG